MKLLELNMALVEVYRESNRATHATKDMATRSKLACQQAKAAHDLWQTLETQ